jgi:hypothetical protein
MLKEGKTKPDHTLSRDVKRFGPENAGLSPDVLCKIWTKYEKQVGPRLANILILS